MKDGGDETVRSTLRAEDKLHGDAQHAAAGSLRQRVLTRLGDLHGLREDAHGRVLTREIAGNRAAVGRTEVERDDVFGFLNAVDAFKGTPAGPAALSSGLLVVDILFGLDEDVGEHAVGSGPGINQFRRSGGTEHFLNGFNEVVTDDLILLGANAKRAVALSDLLDGAEEVFRMLNVLSISKHGSGERLLLRTASLVRLIEDVAQFGVLRKHARIEMLGEIDAVGLQNGNGGLDQFDLMRGQHENFSLIERIMLKFWGFWGSRPLD